MAVIHTFSNELIEIQSGNLLNTTDLSGKVRIGIVNFTQVGAGDIDSTITFMRFKPGRVIILGSLCFLYNSAYGASCVLDIGHTEYKTPENVKVVADSDYFDVDLDVAAAGELKLCSNFAGKNVTVSSINEWYMYATVKGAVIPDGATLNGVVAYAVN